MAHALLLIVLNGQLTIVPGLLCLVNLSGHSIRHSGRMQPKPSSRPMQKMTLPTS